MDVANEPRCLDNITIIYLDLQIGLIRTSQERHVCGRPCDCTQIPDLRQLQGLTELVFEAAKQLTPSNPDRFIVKVASMIYLELVERIGESAKPQNVLKHDEYEDDWFEQVARMSASPETVATLRVDSKTLQSLVKEYTRRRFAGKARAKYESTAKPALEEAAREAGLEWPPPDTPSRNSTPGHLKPGEWSKPLCWSLSRSEDTWLVWNGDWNNQYNITKLEKAILKDGKIVCHCYDKVTAQLQLLGDDQAMANKMLDVEFSHAVEKIKVICRSGKCDFSNYLLKIQNAKDLSDHLENLDPDGRRKFLRSCEKAWNERPRT